LPLLSVVLTMLLATPGPAAGEDSAAPSQEDEAFILECLELARSATAKGNDPFGAVLVKDGRVVMRAENTVTTDDNVTHHAETNLLAAVFRQLGPEEARGATLYTSAEPCAMCCGAIYLMGVERVVFGLPQRRLAAMSGFEEYIGARETMALGQREVEVVGPVREEEAAAVVSAYLDARHHPPHPPGAATHPPGDGLGAVRE
jgi:tRNA(Arg) A34 adenosine deaminase TadA